MDRRSEAGWNAVAATAFVVVIAAVVAAAAAYMGLLGGERLLEFVAVVPSGWGKSHQHQVTVWAMAAAVPVTVAIGWWTFRRALAGERALVDDHSDC